MREMEVVLGQDGDGIVGWLMVGGDGKILFRWFVGRCTCD